ncbi:phage integrase family protein [Mycolicibacterium vanbaalenii PYR-1]|uniref:Phage integrase family protein n=2 Tax=Mycolicibacterium TaxID=1866885 RepID=A1T2C2_MYCVP|nr:phage integrase family protein [Mycolicibacterium vanbaalenii PYR-1]ABM16702.1 phage integrase family protein [Mycolicibacterium vanbaalenii PYR-1]KDE97222.1 integrase [Mycolicibacterium aromaticivorans JS19b1 = JCM 16368]
MGKRQRDCVDCGAPVGYIGREHCCHCTRRLRAQAAKARCPGCGWDRIVLPETDRCMLCSRRCRECGGPIKFRGETVCRPCQKRATLAAAKSTCPRCAKPGYLRESTGWCGPCSRPRPPKYPPRICVSCGELRRHAAHGMCGRCWQRHPDRPFVRGETLAAALTEPPGWLGDFVAYLAARHCPARACRMIATLARLLEDEHPNHPQSVLERSRRPGRSMGSLARALEAFFTEHGLAMATDQDQRLAAGRRQKRIDATPGPMRVAVAAFAESMLHNRDRARRAGTRPRSDRTIESALTIVRDLAHFLEAQRGKQDWALVDVTDIEAFLAELPNTRARRLTVLGQFFRFARNRRVVLVDPTHGMSAKRHRGFRGRTLTITQQRDLFRRWSADPAAHPHEALFGLLAILHGVSSRELRLLQVDHIDTSDRSIRLGTRPHPVPLDPVSWNALQRSLDHRDTQRTNNPHVIVTRGTKADRRPASEAYMSHLLDPCGLPPKMLRSTRLADLVNTIDPKLVAAAFGMRPEGAMIYLADHLDEGRLPDHLAQP